MAAAFNHTKRGCAYVTLLKLRGYVELTAYPDKKIAVTEQIYVHSKLMIVDDQW